MNAIPVRWWPWIAGISFVLALALFALFYFWDDFAANDVKIGVAVIGGVFTIVNAGFVALSQHLNRSATENFAGNLEVKKSDLQLMRFKSEKFYEAQVGSFENILASIADFDEQVAQVKWGKDEPSPQKQLSEPLRKMQKVVDKERLFLDKKSIFGLDCVVRSACQTRTENHLRHEAAREHVQFYLGHLADLLRAQLGGPGVEESMLGFATTRAMDLISSQQGLTTQILGEDYASPQLQQYFKDAKDQGGPHSPKRALEFATANPLVVMRILWWLSRDLTAGNKLAGELRAWLLECGGTAWNDADRACQPDELTSAVAGSCPPSVVASCR